MYYILKENYKNILLYNIFKFQKINSMEYKLLYKNIQTLFNI